MNSGWKCPVCGRGLSPYVTVCPCDGRGVQYVWSNTTAPLKCEHDWIGYPDVTAPFRQCRKCWKVESI